MSANVVRGFLRALGPHKASPLVSPFCLRDPLGPRYEQTRGYPTQKHQKLILAAQKRNRARKLQKEEEVEVDFVTAKKRAALQKTVLKSKRYDPGNNLPPEPYDDVYHRSWYREAAYSLEECIQMHREVMHPSMMNMQDNVLVATVELNMHTKKKNRFLEGFEGTLLYPHSFPNKTRITKIICFCRSADEAVELMENGANLAGGVALVKKLTAGEVDITEFDHILSTVEMIEDIQPLRTLLKKRMPTSGKTISSDGLALVKAFRKSIIYEVKRDIYEADYAQFSVPLARLDMPLDQIEANVMHLFTEVNEHIPSSRPVNSFVSQVFISSPPSPERFVLRREPYEKRIAETTIVREPFIKGKRKDKKAAVAQIEEDEDATADKQGEESDENETKVSQQAG